MTTMRQTYVTPMCNMEWMDSEEMLAVSGVESNNGIEYGGFDEDGDQEPEVKLFQLINFDF